MRTKTGLALAGLLTLAAFGENLVKEDMRAFDVPFNGEGKMGLKYVQVRFPEGTEGVVISAEVKIDDVEYTVVRQSDILAIVE